MTPEQKHEVSKGVEDQLREQAALQKITREHETINNTVQAAASAQLHKDLLQVDNAAANSSGKM